VQLVGTRSASQPVNLSNVGPITLDISSITIIGDFIQRNNCGTELPAGASCTINVSFQPTMKGLRTGTLTITDNGAGSPQTISLTGTGTVVQLSASSLNFGDQRVGTSSSPQRVSLTNRGTDVLRITNISVGGQNFADFVATTNCPASLPAGTSCQVSVTF